MKKFSVISLFLLALMVVVPSVFAQGYGKDRGIRQDDKMMRRQVTPGEGRMTACQAREASIKNRMLHLTQLAEGMEENFDKHLERIKAYYTDKVVPSGKTVANYDELLAAVKAQEEVVEDTLKVAEADANAFSCTSGTLKEQTTKFREDMHAVKSALKDYRTAIKNLIVAIRSVTGEENKMSPTEQP